MTRDNIMESMSTLVQESLAFVDKHSVKSSRDLGNASDDGFSLFRDSTIWDLYGMIDAVYTLYTIGQLSTKTNRESRARWAQRILSCQDESGWFSKRNLRGHSKAHATAYAIGALSILECESIEAYVDCVQPLHSILPYLIDPFNFLRWIESLDFRFTPKAIIAKELGWHYIWRGSHIGGGIPAAIGMTQHLFKYWWPGQVNSTQWFNQYFDWLDDHVNPQTGYWQRAFFNRIYRRPTLIDMGGAVHFYWIYEAMERHFPYPEAVILSTLGLQRHSGLYKDHPFCIDLDGNYCLIRAYLQLSPECQSLYRDSVYRAVERNFEAIMKSLTLQPFEQIYSDSHGLPGALAALVECNKLPNFKYADALLGWQHPLDRVWWL